MRLTRRFAICAGVALAACSRSGAPTALDAQNGLRSIRGKGLYVETSGPPDAPAVLYLHGGPGAGGYDFSLTQRERLSRRLRLVVLDQRGVLRSDPLGEGEPCTLRDLIEDTEALREDLGIQRWSIIGHSFGGFLGLHYALAYPDSVEYAIFENPSFDLDSSARELMRGAAHEYGLLRDEANARACREAAAAPTSPRETWDAFGRLTNNLGPARDNLYVHGPEKNFFGRLVNESGLPQEMWGRGATHQRRLFEEGALFEPIAPRLPELRAPALLIHGNYDHVTGPDQVTQFSNGPSRTIAMFENSAHFAHYEEQQRYAEVVTNFLLA